MKTHRTSFDKLFQEQISDVPKLILQGFLEKKLADAGAPNPADLVEALANHLLNGDDTSDSFVWDDGKSEQQNIEIALTEEDAAALEKKIDQFLDNLPEVIDDVASASAKQILRTMQRDWPDQLLWEENQMDRLSGRLNEKWGEGLNYLRMLATSCAEMGEESHQRLSKSRAKKNRTLRGTLIRIHARSCQVLREILVLLESGYADGAMARWRTLCELGVVATILVDGGEDLAQRYLDHDAFEAKRALDEYDQCHEALGYRPVTKRERLQTERGHVSLLEKYGKSIDQPNGWAADHLGLKRVTFRDLEDAAQKSFMRSYHKMASYNVHADIRGLVHQLGSFDDVPTILAGPSAYGLVEPGQNAAITIVQITGLLEHERASKLDTMIRLKILLLLRGKAINAFVKSDRKMKREHKIHTLKSKN